MILTDVQAQDLYKILSANVAGHNEKLLARDAGISDLFFEKFYAKDWNLISEKDVKRLAEHLNILDDVEYIISQSYTFNKRADYLHDLITESTLPQVEQTIRFLEDLLKNE